MSYSVLRPLDLLFVKSSSKTVPLARQFLSSSSRHSLQSIEFYWKHFSEKQAVKQGHRLCSSRGEPLALGCGNRARSSGTATNPALRAALADCADPALRVALVENDHCVGRSPAATACAGVAYTAHVVRCASAAAARSAPACGFPERSRRRHV